MAVIAISQQIGSRGVAFLGELAAKEPGYRFLSAEQLLGQTATRFNVSAEQMKWFDVHTPHFWDRQKSDGPASRPSIARSFCTRSRWIGL